jgi:hypothetical protein
MFAAQHELIPIDGDIIEIIFLVGLTMPLLECWFDCWRVRFGLG